MKRLLKWSWAPSWGLALLALTAACDASAMAQRTFATPDEAVQALITARSARDHREPEQAQVEAAFGLSLTARLHGNVV